MKGTTYLFCLWASFITGVMSRNRFYGTFYDLRGTTGISSSTYTPAPFAVGDLSSAVDPPAEDPPAFVFVPGSAGDDNTMWKDRYSSPNCSMTFSVATQDIFSYTGLSYLNVSVETTADETDCFLFTTTTTSVFNISNNYTTTVTVGVPPGVLVLYLYCNALQCQDYKIQCSDLIDFLDNSFTDPHNPLVFSADKRNEIKANMPTTSLCGTPTFQWRMIGIEDNQTSFFKVTKFAAINDILLINENSLAAGMYIVFLEVTTPSPHDTHFEDYIYLRIKLPELRPVITGPIIRTIQAGTISYIRGYESSDPAFRVPSVRSYALDANWYVYASDVIDKDGVEECVYTFPECAVLTSGSINDTFVGHNVSYGGLNLMFDTTIVTSEYALVIYTMTSNGRRSSVLTVLHIKNNAFNNFQFSCVYSCLSTVINKYPPGVAGFDVFVNANTNVYKLDYVRDLREWDDAIGKFVPSSIKLEQGQFSDSMSLTDQPLAAGTAYILLLDITLAPITVGSLTNRTISLAVLKSGNYIPYGGHCTIDRHEGNATVDVYTASCYGWMDEEDRYRRNNASDVNPRLTYMVVQRTSVVGVTEPVDEILVVSERPTMRFVVMEGNPGNAYKATIVVKILDIFNEAAEVDFTVTSVPIIDASTVTPNAESAELVWNFTRTIDELFYQHDPNLDMSLPMGIGAAKVLNSISVPPSELDLTLSIDGEPGVLIDLDINKNASRSRYSLDSYLTALYNTTLDSATTAIRESIELIARRIDYVKNQRVTSGQKYYDQNYLDQMTQCFSVLILVQSYVTDDTKVIAETALATLAAASGQIWQSQPQSEDQETNSKTKLMDMTGNIVGVVVPDTLNQARVVYDMGSAFSQLDDMVELSGPSMSKAVQESAVSPNERAFLYMESQKRLQSELSKSKDLARATAQSMNSMTQDILETTDLCTGCSLLLGSNSIVQNVSVLPSETLNNVTLMAKSVSLNMNLGLTKNISRMPVAMTHIDKNIFMYDDDFVSSFVSYGVLHVDLRSTETVTLDTVTYEQAVDQVDRDLVYPYVHEEDVSQFSLHRFLYRSPADEVCINLEPLGGTTSRYDVYLRLTEEPTILDYDAMFTISADNGWITCLDASAMQGHRGMAYLGIKNIQGGSHSRKRRDDEYAENMNFESTIQRDRPHIDSPTSSAYRRYAGRRRKRSANVNVTSQHTPYYFAVITAACLNWDDTKSSWNSDYCKLTWVPSSAKVTCVCQNVPQMTFGTSFFVAPNLIDFSSAFLRFSPKSQAAIIATIAIVIVVYVLLLVWARREDKKDMLKWGILPLADNYPEDEHCYLISVHTGLRLGAGTESRVGFVLSGHRTDTGFREMYDGVRKQFPAGSVVQFIMSTQYHLGQLTHLRVWHDNSGPGAMASWYLSRVTVYDMRKKETYNFLCETWLSVETCSGSALECTLPATNPETEAFDYTFMNHAKRTLSDDHTWASFLYRPNFSNFTRAQRVTCAILFIMVNMVVNAMYYNPGEEYETDTLLEVGPCRLSLKQLYVSIITALITTPSTFLIVLIFKMSRRSTMRVTENRASDEKYRTESQNGSRPAVEVSFCTRFCSGVPKTDDVPVMYIEEENRKCLLPSRFAYVGWFLALGGMVSSAFFVLAYSMQWGEQKSGEWLATFLMSLLQSVFFVDPIKVAAFAVGLAFVKKKLESSDFKNIDSETVENLSKNADQSDELPREPLTPNEVNVAREKSKVATRWNRIVLDLVYNVLFLWLLLSISYSNTNSHAYHMHRTVANAMTLNSTGNDEFGAISSAAAFYKWLTNTAVPRLFPESYTNGDGLDWLMREFMEGLALYRVGPPRLRQFRIEKESCHLPMVDTKDCYRGYSLVREEEDDFCIGWGSPPCPDSSNNFTEASWRYTDLDTSDSQPMLGDISTYWGDGYFMTMDINKNLSLAFIDELYGNIWIDRHTRAIVLEFTVFCANINMFAYSMFLVEFPASGGAFSSYSVYPAKIYHHEGAFGSYIFACEIIGLLLMVLLVAQLGYGLFNYKFKAFRKFWFLLDFLRFCVLVATVVLYVIRQRVLTSAIEEFQENRRVFVDFYHVTCWNQLVIYMLGVSVFMATIRVLKILEGNKNIYIISSVFSKLASELFWFGVLFFYFLGVFATLGYLLFGSRLRSYMNLYTSLVTLFVSLMGRNSFAEMNESDPIIAKFYFFFFVCIISMLMFSIILSSLTQCIMKVTEEFNTRAHKQDAFHYGFNKIASKILGRPGDKAVEQDRVFPFRDVNSRQRTMETL